MTAETSGFTKVIVLGAGAVDSYYDSKLKENGRPPRRQVGTRGRRQLPGLGGRWSGRGDFRLGRLDRAQRAQLYESWINIHRRNHSLR